MPDIRAEAAAAAAWWATALRAAAVGVDVEHAALFEQVLAEQIEARCEEGAWQPDIPTYGSCGRQVTSSPRPAEADVVVSPLGYRGVSTQKSSPPRPNS